MPQSMTIGELLVRIAIKSDTREAKQFQQGMQGIQRTAANAARAVEPFAKGLRVLGLALAAIGTASFKVGADVERGFLKLRTQLGATQEEIDSMRPLLEQLARDTGRSLADVVEGYFALRSSGQDASTAFETLTASVKASAIQLGSARDIAHTAGGAVNAYGQESLSGARAVDILALAVKEGNFEARELSGSMGKLLQVGPQLGIEFEQLATIIAKGTSSSIGAREVITQLEQVLSGILRPTETAKRQFDAMGISVRELQRRADEDLIGTLQGLRSELGDDKEAFSRLFESQEAVALLFDLTGPRAEQFRQTLENIQTTTGVVDEGFLLWGKSGFANVEQATNNLKLALTNFYDTVLVPLLQLFGKLPSAMQTVVLGMGAMQIASTIGLGPSVGGLVTSLWRSIGALRALGRRLAMASLAMLRFATRAIVAGISAVITFGAAIWASLIPPLIAATAAVVGFTIALLANPVVLIVAAIIGAFVALGFVVYKFRRQILGALKTALAWVKGNWPLLVGILFGPFGIVGALIWKFRDDIVDAIMWIKDQSTGIFTSLRDFIIGIWEGLGAAIGGAFRGVINAVISGLNKALDAASSFVESIKGALDKAPFGNPLGDFLLGVASKLRAGLPNLAIGGIVPGPLGRPLLATVHGGEMVLPVGASRVIAQMLEGFRLGPAALPQAPHYYGQMYRSSVVNRTVNINMNEPIVIQTQATDAKGIAQELHEEIQDQIRNVAYDHDGPVER